MKLLTKYIFKNHTRLILMTLGIGVSLFILIDLIEKADIFMASKKPMLYALEYYVLKMPFIVSQILPSVFLLASVIFLAIMIAAREGIALQAGGISMFTITKVLVYVGIFWAILQFVLAQLVMPLAEQKAFNLWRYDVRERIMVEQKIDNLWFIDNGYIVQVDEMTERGKGKNLTAYKLSSDAKEIEEIIRAKNVFVEDRVWKLENVVKYNPSQFETTKENAFVLPVSQSIRFYFISTADEKPQSLSFFVLTEAIEKLKTSGSNIENLLTIWHSKITYAVMVIVFSVLAVAIISYKENIYLAVIMATVIAFISYALNVLGISLGQSGKLPPVFAAWFPCILLFLLGYLRIYIGYSKR